MKINIKNFSIFIIIVCSFSISANNIIELSINKNSSADLNKSLLNNTYKHKIYLDTIFNSKDKAIRNIPNESITNNIFDTSQQVFILNKGEFVKVQSNDGIKKLFNGSIIIKFNLLPNLKYYADTHNIEFVTDISNLNRGIFRISNLHDLHSKIKELQLDKNILEIELQTIDPRLKVE